MMSYIFKLVLSTLGPADAVEGDIRSTVLPVNPETGLGHLREPQVLRSRDNIWNVQDDKLSFRLQLRI